MGAERTKNDAFSHHVKNLFHMLEPDHTGQIARADYMAHIEDPSLQAYMMDIGIDPKEAKLLFGFIDSDNSNTIDSEELISGLVRLRQGAKFMDVMTMMYEMEQQHRKWLTWSFDLAACLTQINEKLVGSTRNVLPNAKDSDAV